LPINWEPIVEEVYIRRLAEGNRIGWTGAFASSTRFRLTSITTKGDWDAFTSDTYLCTYEGGAWDTPGATNLTFIEGYLRIPRHPRKVLEPGWRIITAFHTAIGKRLIVDGMHRGFQTERNYREKGVARAIQIVECYGPEVNVTFPWDFRPLLSRFGPQ
jgi:hypothetical protein